MAVKVKLITLWRREVDNRPGALAETVAPLSRAGANLQVLMGYRHPGDARATIELSPVSGKKATAAAQQAGLSASGTPTLFVEGDDRPGLAHAIARSLADAGINLRGISISALGGRFSAYLAFDNADVATLALQILANLMD